MNMADGTGAYWPALETLNGPAGVTAAADQGGEYPARRSICAGIGQ